VPSTVHRVLTRYRLARLTHLHRSTGRVIRRYERDSPGEPVHVDIRKLRNIPDGDGHKAPGRPAGRKNVGYSHLHTAVDDHSRLAYSEILTNEKKETATAFLTRAQAFFTSCGITVERILTDDGSRYRSRDWRDLLAAAGITHKRTRPYRPQTNGTVERLNRTLLDERAYARPHRSEAERREAFPSGCIPTITTADTPRSQANHPPATSPTSQSNTARPPVVLRRFGFVGIPQARTAEEKLEMAWGG
jgi:transposase InsO family protein